MRILAIIPAKLDSKRLPKKNIQRINDKTLVHHSIDYALASKYDVTVIVSTEDWQLHNDIALLSGQHGYEHVYPDMRDPSLCGDVEVVEVYERIVEDMEESSRLFDLVVALQPDHPDREHTFDECVAYFIENNYDDLITVEDNYRRSGSVRIFKMEHLEAGRVSRRIGILRDNATDIHYEADLERARVKMNEN